jgi:hypothetical protein
MGIGILSRFFPRELRHTGIAVFLDNLQFNKPGAE